jgi:hypothetical protein
MKRFLSCVAALVTVVFLAGCAGNWRVKTNAALTALSQTTRTAHIELQNANVCGLIIQDCILAGLDSNTCEPFKDCVRKYVYALKSIESAFVAVELGKEALKASANDPKARDAAQKYLASAISALRHIVDLLKVWGINLPIPGV